MDQHAGGKWLIHDTKRRKDNQLQSLKHMICGNYASTLSYVGHEYSSLPHSLATLQRLPYQSCDKTPLSPHHDHRVNNDTIFSSQWL